jgi:hypothetical protein
LKNDFALLICLTVFAAQAPAQEDAPQPDPATQEPESSEQQPAPEQEPEPELEIPGLPGQDAAMEEVMEAIENVREAFVRVDRLWTEARGAADDALLDPEAPQDADLTNKLLAGVSEASTLIADIEHLLAILPESDSDQQQQQQQSGGQQQQQQQEGDQHQQDRDGENPDGTDDPALRGNQEALQPATGDVPPDAPPIFLAPGSGGGSWGHLPPRLQQTLQNSHAEDLPLRYRGLLEQFHKRRVRD